VIDPLPKELASLIANERATTASATVREAVRAKLAVSIGSIPLGAAAATSVIKIVTIVALAIGAGTVAIVKSPASAPVPPATGPVAHVEPWELARDMPDARVETAVAPPPAVPAAVAPVAPVTPVPAVKPRTVLGEADLIGSAWAALSDHDPARALVLAKRDEQEHPNGVLAEECAAITIVALARLDRLSEATAAAERFTQAYPNSIHRELVANALTGGNP